VAVFLHGARQPIRALNHSVACGFVAYTVVRAIPPVNGR